MSINLFRQNPKMLVIFVKQCKTVFPETCKDLEVIKTVCNMLTIMESEKGINDNQLNEITLDKTAVHVCKQNNEILSNESNPKKGGNIALFTLMEQDELRNSINPNCPLENLLEFTEFNLNED